MSSIILQFAFIAVCWFLAFFQWAMTMTEGHLDARKDWSEAAIAGEIVVRSMLLIGICMGSVALSGIAPK